MNIKTTNIFLEGDTLVEMKQLEEKSVNLVLADLPYGTTAGAWDTPIDMGKLWLEYKRVLAQDGVVLLFGAQPFTTTLINSNPKWFKYCWYWIKNQGTNFFHAKRMPIRKVEEVVVFAQNNKSYRPQMSQGHPPTRPAKGKSSGRAYHGENIRNEEGGKTERFPDQILNFKCVPNNVRLHQSQKPVELLSFLIESYTKPGDNVLDNTMGSGSTGCACADTGRNFVGIEKDKDEFNRAIKRINEHSIQQPCQNPPSQYL